MSTADQRPTSIEHRRTAVGVAVLLRGDIDETFNKELFRSGLLPTDIVVVDLDDVHRITSYGVREFRDAVASLGTKYCGFVRCRPAIISQFNTVNRFGGEGQLVSLYFPYECASCEKQFEVLVDLRQAHTQVAAFDPPPASCPTCGNDATFDDAPEVYFDFAASQPAPAPPEGFDDVLHATTAVGTRTGTLRIRKDVHGSTTGIFLAGKLDGRNHFRRLRDGLEGDLLVDCRGLADFTAEGVERMCAFLEDSLGGVHLTQIPLEIVPQLRTRAALCARTTVHSVRPALSCPTHGKVRVVIQAPELERGGWSAALLCPTCGLRATLPGSEMDVQLGDLRGPEPTNDVRALLEGHERQSEPSVAADGTQPLVAGRLVLGRYALLRRIAVGGMAEVFLARQSAIGGFEKDVVLKSILPGLNRDKSFVDMFLQEARLSARISHPNVVQIFDIAEEGPRQFIVMEYVRGPDLAAVFRLAAHRKAKIPIELAAWIVAEIASGLYAAHQNLGAGGTSEPIIHRDVSPHNVLVSLTGHVKLTDFGIARASGATSATPTSMIKGKIPYLAPELLAAGARNPDARVDIFPTGIVLYQALTFVHPFRRQGDLLTMAAIGSHNAPPPSSLRPEIPPELDAIVARAIAREPSDRYQTALALEQDLRQVIAKMGKSPGPAKLAAYLDRLIDDANKDGVLPTDMTFTPSPMTELSFDVADPEAPSGVTRKLLPEDF